MITAANFKDLLETLGFQKNKEVYEKHYDLFDITLSADFSNRKLYYPSSIKGRERNDNFDAPENFVVFECVHRLLEKGYRPEHIELEKEWHLGHDLKSGRADICVIDQNGEMLFIVECKTWGREYEKALADTVNDGGQLFSYWQQEQACRWLVLYSSDIKNNKVEYKAPVIDCSDDKNIILLSKKDKTLKLYGNAHTAIEKHNVWSETYSCQFHDDLIFAKESVAYRIGVKPLLKKDLQDFKPEDKIVNKFEEILRHNNVSDKENAFNRLVALFICKLVDEITKHENEEVEFQYKPGSDTYETLQDRLQRLHRDGMEKFMREKIYYVSADYPEKLFATYTGATREQAIKDLQNTIKILKFYSNNDFAFKDVHNEELFYQNGKILVEMVQLFEKYRIVYPSKHQFLGDLFEQLLNKGFKQNEGQFFTPMPITRFIWDSLPINKFIKDNTGTGYPKVIDYACGAGHFLTEAIETINFFLDKNDNNDWVRDHIYGIEKDYRLARVAKISLFMNGAGEGNIVFGDGLESDPEKGIENGTFDLLVANPPYSVKDFKQHLKLKNNTFVLLDKIGVNGGEIETLFVERIGQLLKAKGVAAVILPSSILSNDTASYIGAREQFLQNFYIRAIVSLGSKTFGATGTNTVIMFLEKFNEPPKYVDLYTDSVSAIFNGDDLVNWRDQDILESYANKIGVEVDVYKSVLQKKLDINELSEYEYFKLYVDTFAKSPEIKKLISSKGYKKRSKAEQQFVYLENLYSYIFGIEREKLLYFSLVHEQNTVIINAPTDNKDQKTFLGYDWSNRKGNEGIQIINPGGKLYSEQDRCAEGTLAAAIRDSFLKANIVLNDEQQKYSSVVRTKDLLDFSRPIFNKSVRLHIYEEVQIKSKYPVIRLGDICEILIGGTPSRKNPQYFTGSHLWVSIAEMKDQVINDTKEKITDDAIKDSNVKLIKAGTTLLSFKLSIGRTAIAGKDLYTNEAIAALKPKKEDVTDLYLYYLFKGRLIDLENVGHKAFGKSLNSTYLREEVKIPVPPIDIQMKIIDQCKKIDKEYQNTRMTIELYRKEIEEIFADLDVISRNSGGGQRLRLDDSDRFYLAIGKRVLSSQITPEGKISVISANVFDPFGYIDELLIKDFSVPSVLWGIDGDWMTRFVPEGIEFYPTDHCGVLRCKTQEVNPVYLAHLLEIEGRKLGFSRSFRASLDRIQGISILVPNRRIQDEKIEQIREIQTKINELEKYLESEQEKIKKVFIEQI